jgi:GntR family transcriptional regulator
MAHVVVPAPLSSASPGSRAAPSAAPKVIAQHALPTEPSMRGSKSLYLTEAQQQGLRPDRRMLYIGLEPASEHIAACCA